MTTPTLTDSELAAIEAQLDSTVPYYVPALVRELRAIRAALQRWEATRAAYLVDGDVPSVVEAMVAAADHLSEFAGTEPTR